MRLLLTDGEASEKVRVFALYFNKDVRTQTWVGDVRADASTGCPFCGFDRPVKLVEYGPTTVRLRL